MNSVSSLRYLSILAQVSKLILLTFGCIFLMYSASRICSFCLLFCCSNIVVFSVKIFRNSVVEHEYFFRCCAMKLVLERCIVSLPRRVVEVKPTYTLLFSEKQSSKGHLNWYITLVFCKTPIEGVELSLMTKLEVLNLSYYMVGFLGSVGSMFRWINGFCIFSSNL